MHDLGIAGTEFHRVHVALDAQAKRDDEAAVEIGAVGGNGVRLGHAHGQVGVGELRAAGGGHGREVGGIPFGRPGGGPAADGFYFRTGQPARAFEISVAGFRFPGWHVARGCDLRDERGAFGCVGVGQQREGSYLTGTMAGDAALVENRRDVASEGDWRGRRACLSQPEQEYEGAHYSSIP